MVLEGHTKTVRELAVHGDRAVSASYDDEARGWDVRDGECLQVLKGHEKHLYAVAFDGLRIATGGLDAEIKV
jgi:F-box and WD-40 domain protein CDC4